MGEFKRSPSKVWWAEEGFIDWRHRSASGSPGSQDSGFSDTENSPQNLASAAVEATATPKRGSTPQRSVRKGFFKGTGGGGGDAPNHNLSTSYKEKGTPVKSISLKFAEEERLSKSLDSGNRKGKMAKPRCPGTDPAKKSKYVKGPSRASKSLFGAPSRKDRTLNQYAHGIGDAIDSAVTYEDSFEIPRAVRTLPLSSERPSFAAGCYRNSSAPAALKVLAEDEGVTSFNGEDGSDEYDSELESLFRRSLISPEHTSTPKLSPHAKMRHRRSKLPLRLFRRCHQERIPPLAVVNTDDYHDSVQRWLQETRHLYEPEFMTTLQCKSIAAELGLKVSKIAALSTASFRDKLIDCEVIEGEFMNLRGQTLHIGPAAQSLAGQLTDFIKKHCKDKDLAKIAKHCDSLRRVGPENAIKITDTLYSSWKSIAQVVLLEEVQEIVSRLEEPKSELELRATVTAITSLSLRHESLIALFTSSGAVQNFITLCEKCDGSSLRALILRALSTICCNTSAVRQFEKASGVQVIADVLEDHSRPEPERSEAVALLAQITAPWIEDNHNVSGLQEKARSLVKSLTGFGSKTKCCQNLLLCVAALSNLTTMESKCMKYVLQQNTLKAVLDAVKQRGSYASIYLLEQVSTLMANMSSLEEARRQLTVEHAPALIMCFLQTAQTGDDVEKRLQQKSMIALSRLCGDPKAAQQVVDLGGVNKLVRLCREKGERYDSDAVLVAALATLRKIVDVCGRTVISTQDAQELIEPRLLDSFLTYSTQNESYV